MVWYGVLQSVAGVRDARWRKGLIVASVLLLAAAHWGVRHNDKQIHNLLYHLDFIPILIAGMLFGWRWATWVTVLTGAAEFPLVWILWGNDPVYAMDQVAEISIFGVAGMVVGALADRERRQRAKLEKTSQELATVYTELQQNLERLKKAERLYAVAQLSASLAHEIRNPLASLSGAAGIIKRGNASPQNLQECVEIIDKESQRLNKLLSNFLDFARPRVPRLQPTDLGAVIDSVIRLAAHSPGASEIEFRRNISGELPEVECDSEQLKQVLLNLVINAIQATGKGVVQLEASAREGKALITVRDQGSGIPAEQQDRIFDPFFTTKEDGTGLGLAIASKIVEQHGGVLTAENLPGSGLTMIVELPLERERTP